jgi:3-deoxy-manno-octulosonate cytidylyltransferase (CMP-KDO synthetase)
MLKNDTLIVVPARFGSKRLPGKPLLPIAGVPLIERVAAIARKAADIANARYVIATDDQRIGDFCDTKAIPFVMTSQDIATGSDRVLAAADAFDPHAEYLVNLQGDSPFTPARQVVALVEALRTAQADCVTPVISLTWKGLDDLREHKRKAPFSGTTCVRGNDGRAYWFSKSIQPAIRDEDKLRAVSDTSPVFRHVGLYGYRKEALKRFCVLPEATYEKLEGLEQLRFLENGMTISTVIVGEPEPSMGGVDTLADIALAEQLIAQYSDPHA